MVLGKGLSGGYLPIAITLATEEIFSRFDGSIAEGKALAYGHSYTANSLGCAAAKASLEVFEKENVLESVQARIEQMHSELQRLGDLPAVQEVRQCGLIAGIELKEITTPAPGQITAAEVCVAARRHGLLTRAIRNVIVLMPPLCITPAQLSKAVDAIRLAILEVCERAAG
jgi:adenosylmethionine-8-amino-7-oxononanoate aminotransferase